MNVPVLIVGFNRPELIVKRISELYRSTVIPEKVYVSIDGGGEIIQSEIVSLINQYFDRLSIEIVFRNKNLGCSNHILNAVSEVLSKNQNIIVIEDDVSISPNFIEIISLELLKVNEKTDIAVVGGFSPFVIPYKFTKIIKNYWRETSYFSAWGWGTTKYFWDDIIVNIGSNDIEDSLKKSKAWDLLSERKKRIWLKRFSRQIWDYQVQYNLFLQDKKSLLPVYRLIDNEGFSDARSTHTKHNRPWNFFGQGYSLKGPKTKLKRTNNLFWKFVDANFWAADGHFNARSREKGLRTILKLFFVDFLNLLKK